MQECTLRTVELHHRVAVLSDLFVDCDKIYAVEMPLWLGPTITITAKSVHPARQHHALRPLQLSSWSDCLSFAPRYVY